MQRVTITFDDELLTAIDRIAEARGYQNRSEAIRDLARAGLQRAADPGDDQRPCVAALVYVYDHAARDLSRRLVKTFHDHNELSLASMHVHLDHDNCMEVSILKGKGGEIQHFAEHIIAERGVRHGQIVRLPTRVRAGSKGLRKSPRHTHGAKPRSGC
ncbi:MAG: nickel-responsive transcriptional regulator NikR [Rhizobiales bacterium]|nr:nickel-responsive transcriptional regulator NikR [Hyphomicrobiales bacterium]